MLYSKPTQALLCTTDVTADKLSCLYYPRGEKTTEQRAGFHLQVEFSLLPGKYHGHNKFLIFASLLSHFKKHSLQVYLQCTRQKFCRTTDAVIRKLDFGLYQNLSMQNYTKSQSSLACQLSSGSETASRVTYCHIVQRWHWLWSTYPAWLERSNTGQRWTQAHTAHGLCLFKSFHLHEQ